jgi:hypothetical protein
MLYHPSRYGLRLVHGPYLSGCLSYGFLYFFVVCFLLWDVRQLVAWHSQLPLPFLSSQWGRARKWVWSEGKILKPRSIFLHLQTCWSGSQEIEKLWRTEKCLSHYHDNVFWHCHANVMQSMTRVQVLKARILYFSNFLQSVNLLLFSWLLFCSLKGYVSKQNLIFKNLMWVLFKLCNSKKEQ